MKIVKIILLGTLVLTVLLVVALFAAVAYIDPNRHKDRISRMVYEETGRELQIGGELEWGLWPRIHLAGGAITLGNAPGFGPEPFLNLESFRFSLATWPLLRSKILLDKVEVSGLRLNLARDEQGRNNWDDLSAVPEVEPSKPRAQAPRSAEPPVKALVLGGVEINDVLITWHDQGSGQSGEIRDFNLRVGALSLGTPVELNLAFTAAANQPEIEVVTQLRATLLYDLRNQSYAVSPLVVSADFSGPTVPEGQADLKLESRLTLDGKTARARIEEFKLTGLGMDVDATLEMHGLDRKIPGCQGEITVAIADLVRLLNIFELPLGRQLAGVRERAVNLRSEFTLAPEQGRILIPSLEARLLGTVLSGRLEAENINSPQPLVRGGFKAEGPDMPALLAVGARLVPGADREALTRALTGLSERGILAEAQFTSAGPDIVIPHFYLRGLATEINLEGRLGNLSAPGPSWQGRLAVKGGDLPLLLRVTGAFQGKAGGEAEAELWNLAERLAAARRQTFELTTDLATDLGRETLQINNFNAKALGLELKSQLTAQKILTIPEFRLGLELAPFNPRELLPLLAIALPETADRQALSRLALTTAIAGTAEKMVVKPIDLRLDQSRLQGELKVNDRQLLDLAFDLEIDQLDLDRYLPPKSEQAPAPTPETAAVGAALLPVELLRDLRLDGQLRATKLKISGLQLENFTLGIKARDGRIEVQPLAAALYGGTMAGKVNLDVADQEPVIRSENSLQGVQAGPLLRDYTGAKERLRGQAAVSYQLSTRGHEIADFKTNLNGEARFSFADGAVVGVNIGRLLRQTSALAQGRTLAADEREAVTDFTELTGTAQISNGLVSNRDLNLLSPLLRLRGEGTANLVSEEVDYLLTAAAVASAEGQTGRELAELRGISVPIRVRGTFANLSYRPELSGAGLEQLQQNLRGLGEQLRQEGVRALEGLLGTPQPAPPTEATPQDAPDPASPPETKPQERLEEGLRQLFRR